MAPTASTRESESGHRPPGTGRPGVKGVLPAHKKRCQDAVESNRWGLPDSAGWGEHLDDCPGQQPVCAWLRFLETRRSCLIRQQRLEENRDGDGEDQWKHINGEVNSSALERQDCFNRRANPGEPDQRRHDHTDEA